MGGDQVTAPFSVMARGVIWGAYEEWVEEGWEHMPEIGQYDFDLICETVEKLLPRDVTVAEFQAAYLTLEARAEK